MGLGTRDFRLTLFGTSLCLTLQSYRILVLGVDLYRRCRVVFYLQAISAFEIDLTERNVGVDLAVIPKDRGLERAYCLIQIGPAEMDLPEDQITLGAHRLGRKDAADHGHRLIVVAI